MLAQAPPSHPPPPATVGLAGQESPREEAQGLPASVWTQEPRLLHCTLPASTSVTLGDTSVLLKVPREKPRLVSLSLGNAQMGESAVISRGRPSGRLPREAWGQRTHTATAGCPSFWGWGALGHQTLASTVQLTEPAPGPGRGTSPSVPGWLLGPGKGCQAQTEAAWLAVRTGLCDAR